MDHLRGVGGVAACAGLERRLRIARGEYLFRQLGGVLFVNPVVHCIKIYAKVGEEE